METGKSGECIVCRQTLRLYKKLRNTREEASRYGVGTGLITSKGDSALDGVYKLVAVQNRGGWTPAIKISETVTKTPNPGDKLVWRVYDQRNKATADVLSLADEDLREVPTLTLRHPTDHAKYRVLDRAHISEIEPLLSKS